MKKTVILSILLGCLSVGAHAATAAAAVNATAVTKPEDKPIKANAPKMKAPKDFALGVVDVNRLLTESKLAGKLQDAIATDFKAQRDGLGKTEENFREKATAYERDNDVLSESDRLDQEKVLVELQEKLKKEQYLFSEALNKRRERDMEQFMSAVSKRVEEVAHERGFSLVLPAELVLYSFPDSEITDMVLQGVDAEHAS